MDIASIVKKLESNQTIPDSEIGSMQEYLLDIAYSLDGNKKIDDRFFELYNSCIDNFNSNEIGENDSTDIIIQEFKYKMLNKVIELHKSYIRKLFCMLEPLGKDQKDL